MTTIEQQHPTRDEVRDLVRECELDWHRGFMRLCDGDETNRYEVLIRAAIEQYAAERVAEAHPTKAAADVLAERRRQIEVEGWTPEHDTEHDDRALARAGAAYALASGDAGFVDGPPDFWPDNWQWKPSNQRRMLVKSVALLLAEIERLDRAGERQNG